MTNNFPDNKVHGVNMGPIWGRQDTGGPHVGPMNFAIRAAPEYIVTDALPTDLPRCRKIGF